MTPEERAVDALVPPGSTVNINHQIIERIAEAIRAAEQDAHARGRAEMREECAKMAANYSTWPDLAAAIRALK